MPNRAFLPMIALAGLATGLAACERKAPAEEAVEAQPLGAQTSLWRVETLDDGKVTRTVEICADQAVRDSFSRPAPELSGKPCVRVGDAVETDGTYSVRCRIDDQLYRVGSVTQGDPEEAFTVDMAVTRQDVKGPTFEQVRQYRRLGPCPTGWEIGDSAAPGDPQITNSLTGVTRTLGTSAE